MTSESEALVVPAADPDAPLVITCEHASERLPRGFTWPEEDGWLRGTHWAFDPFAAELARDIAGKSEAAAVLASFSRLLVDPNRPLDSDTLFRSVAEGRAVHMNRRIDERERARRVDCWQGFHRAADRVVGASRAVVALSVHTFTPVYEGERRQVEVGVLFDREQELAMKLAEDLCAAGLDCRLNEPYSGKHGLMYSIDRHARRHGRRALELELRQDLAADPAVRDLVAAVIVGRISSGP